jgi:hypothetical protein
MLLMVQGWLSEIVAKLLSFLGDSVVLENSRDLHGIWVSSRRRTVHKLLSLMGHVFGPKKKPADNKVAGFFYAPKGFFWLLDLGSNQGPTD